VELNIQLPGYRVVFMALYSLVFLIIAGSISLEIVWKWSRGSLFPEISFLAGCIIVCGTAMLFHVRGIRRSKAKIVRLLNSILLVEKRTGN
jgi:hypothetical protein